MTDQPGRVPSLWIVWHPDSSYRQSNVHVFDTEIAALRWLNDHSDFGYRVTGVQSGGCADSCSDCGVTTPARVPSSDSPSTAPNRAGDTPTRADP